MYNKYLGVALFGSFLAKSLMGREISMAEALVYSSLALCILGYYVVDAFNRKREKVLELVPKESTSELEKEVEELKGKMNAVMLRMGFTAK